MQNNNNIATTNPKNASSISIALVANVIRPKAIRLKAVANHPTVVALKCNTSVQEASFRMDKESIEISEGNSEPSILHRPIAHVVSSLTILQKFAYEEHQQILVDARSLPQELYQVNCKQSTLNLHRSLSPSSNTKQRHYSSNYVNDSKKTEDKKSSDGYKWRKYGQKRVKKGEFPRAYYRCVHPACPVKKTVEISKDGEIAEIIYRGDHNHPKPSSKSRDKAFNLDRNGSTHEKWMQKFNLDGNDSHIDIPTVSASFITDGREKATESVTISQKRKNDDKLGDSTVATKSTAVPKLMSSIDDSHEANDGYSWQKYGKKVIKGNPYPRNYYRCSDGKCSARKRVQRVSDDPRSFITIYEGKHHH
ncbi:putative WRKY transcription factor 3 [Platanthera zijinensis]|uniref:WRKY transcription factor 3 n=1 Tax=Platanthera zijinensis TaxID=2320716 RepID=A0AAP0BE25_9ASPA